MKNTLNYKVTKVIALVLCAILPCALIPSVFFNVFDNTIADFLSENLYNFLWCGFYGCILVCLTFKNNWIKTIVITLNLLPFGFLTLGSLMGGVFGPLVLFGKAIIPFLPLY